MEHRVTTAIDAPPQQIWSLLVDLERWPEMTQSITEVRRLDSGPLHVGSEAIIKQPSLPRARWRVTELEPGRSFIWENKSGGVTGVGGHMVDTHGQGSRITLTLSLHGPLARLMDAFVGRLSQRYITMEMEGFRRTAESAHG
jgi:uncharacterized membrane protein